MSVKRLTFAIGSESNDHRISAPLQFNHDIKC